MSPTSTPTVILWEDRPAGADAGGCGHISHAPGHRTGSRVVDNAVGGSCVLYARTASGIDINGRCVSAGGSRGRRYLRGSIRRWARLLVLAQTSVAARASRVVREVIDPRDILVDHSNWVPGRVITGCRCRTSRRRTTGLSCAFYNPRYGVFGSIYRADGSFYRCRRWSRLQARRVGAVRSGAAARAAIQIHDRIQQRLPQGTGVPAELAPRLAAVKAIEDRASTTPCNGAIGGCWSGATGLR